MKGDAAARGARQVHIHYHRPPSRTDLFVQQLVHADEHLIVTLMPETPLVHPVSVGGRNVLENGAPAIWFTWPGLMHDVGIFHDRAGTRTGWYANILTPVEMIPRAMADGASVAAADDGARATADDSVRATADDGVRASADDVAYEWRTTDLYLDVWVDERGCFLLDEEELAHAVAKEWVDPQLARAARAEADRLLQAAAAGVFPPPEVRAWRVVVEHGTPRARRVIEHGTPHARRV